MATNERSGRGNTRYTCGVPSAECQGQTADVSGGLRPSIKRFHASRAQALACMQHHLMSQGYKRLSSTTFAAPNHGPVQMLGKAGHFGGELRPGKGSRSMPAIRTGGLIT